MAMDNQCQDNDREVADRRAQWSEADYHRLLQTVPNPILVADNRDAILFFNRGWSDFAGIASDAAGAAWWMDAVHEMDAQEIANARSKALEGYGTTTCFARLKRRDGEFRGVKLHVAPFDLAERGRGWCLIGLHAHPLYPRQIEPTSYTCKSASEGERQDELAGLRHLTEQFREGQRLSSTGSFTSDLQADENTWSDEYYRIFGLEPNVPPTVEKVRERVHPDDLAFFDSELERGRNGHNGDFHFRVITPQKGLRYIRGIARMIDNIDGRPVFMGVVQDITENKISEIALRERESELRQANYHLTIAQDLSKTGIFVWNLARDESRWSDELYRIFEAVPSAAPWTQALELVHPMDRPSVRGMISRARNGENFENEFRLITRDGSTKNLKAVGRLLTEEAETTFLGAVQDVTDVRQREEALNKVRAELAHVARVSALGTLSASIAHEVSQPLAGILINANACLRMLTSSQPNLDKAVETVHRTLRDAARATEVVRRLRVLFTRSALNVEKVDLNEAASEVAAILEGEFRRALVVLDLQLDETIPKVRGDRIQVQQIILDLLLNALDAVSLAGGDGHRVRAETKSSDALVIFSVSDTGMGLATEMEDLFEAFHATKAERTGIGLCVSRAIVESLDGEIGAKQNEDRGTTFFFSIPKYAD
jgi:PAS domain S-box-containing protein